jgi:hypothetical protein
MNSTVKTLLESIQMGLARTYNNVTILPLIAPADGTFQYSTLGEALAEGNITITETSLAGSVPELMAVNRGHKPVLLIDGEELAGAKQNRVLNTSILIKQVSETRIPVSCTEQGRWSYASKVFSESGNVMAHKARARKTRSVHESLAMCGSPVSNQHEVWDGIAELQAKFCAHSPTSAMSDVYQALPDQIGLVAFIGGEPVGVDIVSLVSAYANLHPKLVRSYTLEGLFDPGSDPGPPPTNPSARQSGATPGQPVDSSAIAARAQAFLAEITSSEECRFASVGHGTDHRYRSAAPKPQTDGPSTPNAQLSTLRLLTGSALVHENEVIHAAFFRLGAHSTPRPQLSTNLAPYRSRRRHYRQ